MILFKGAVQNRKPIVAVKIDEQGNLSFWPEGEHRFVVDTGFTGDFLVPRTILPKLKLKYLGYEKFVLATNKKVSLPIYQGWVKIKNKRTKVVVIPGAELIGMKFLEKVGSRLIGDYKKATVKLIG